MTSPVNECIFCDVVSGDCAPGGSPYRDQLKLREEGERRHGKDQPLHIKSGKKYVKWFGMLERAARMSYMSCGCTGLILR